MENNETLALLNKPLWSLQDIQDYFKCGQVKASNIMKAAKKISVSRLLPSKAKRNNIFEVLGLDLKIELENAKAILEATKAVDDRKQE